MFEPALDVLPEAQREVWPLLSDVPKTFVLYGGTALALRLGHRESLDFDFFSSEPCDHDEFLKLPFLRDCSVLQSKGSTLKLLANTPSGSVKLEFFSNIPFGRVGTPDITSDESALVASSIDIFGTKWKTLLQRIWTKDYLDIEALLRAGFPMGEGLGAARALFGENFPVCDAVRTLCWYEEGDLSGLGEQARQYLRETASSWDFEISQLPIISKQLHNDS